MKQFTTIEKLDTGILYTLELASSVSVLLLAFGLIASMANVLTKGVILANNIIMQRIWAVTQCVGIDAGMSGMINHQCHDCEKMAQPCTGGCTGNTEQGKKVRVY